MARTKIAISVLGNFLSYKEAEYVIESNSTEIEERTRSSVVAIARAKKADKIILLIPFSVASAVCPESILSGHLENAKIELSSKATEFIESEMSDETAIEAYVLPNIGTFKITGSEKQMRLSGSSGTFHEAVYFNIYNSLRSIGEFEIYIDVTHAINSLVLDAVDGIMNSVRTLSAINKIKGSVSIYYSDPFLSDFPDTPLHVRSFKKELMDSHTSSSSLLLSGFVANFNANDYKRSLGSFDLPGFTDPTALKTIVYNHNMGCVLLTSSLNELLLNWKDRILNALKSNISQPQDNAVDNGENSISIQMPLKIERELSATYSVLEIMTSDPFRKGEEPSLDDLKEMSNYIAPPGAYLIKNEIDQIGKAAKKLKEGSILLGDLIENHNSLLFRSPSVASKSPRCGKDDRNFIAHGGLERNVTWVINRDKKIHLSYGPCLEEIKKSVRVFK